MRSRRFWQLTAAFCLKTAAAAVIAVHLFAYLAERRISPEFAALVVAAIGFSQLPGRLFFAAVHSRISTRALITALFALQIIALWLLLYSHGEEWRIWAFAVLFGASNGAVTPARASLIAERYGTLRATPALPERWRRW